MMRAALLFLLLTACGGRAVVGVTTFIEVDLEAADLCDVDHTLQATQRALTDAYGAEVAASAMRVAVRLRTEEIDGRLTKIARLNQERREIDLWLTGPSLAHDSLWVLVMFRRAELEAEGVIEDPPDLYEFEERILAAGGCE